MQLHLFVLRMALSFQIRFFSVGCTKSLGVLGDREHKYTFKIGPGICQTLFANSFLSYPKPLSITNILNIGSQLYVVGEWSSQVNLVCYSKTLLSQIMSE